MQDLHAIKSALPNHNDVALDAYESSPEFFAAWFRQYAAMNPVDRLDLSRAGLHHFPPEACCLNVRVLGLSDNQLTSLPREIAEMTHLEELHLGNNPWTDFPYKIEALPNLRTAHFGRNQDMFEFRGYPRELTTTK